MKLDSTIKKMIKQFKSVYNDRMSCLNHLYLTGGNGYDWKNGELVHYQVPAWEKEENKRRRKVMDDIWIRLTGGPYNPESAPPFDYDFYPISRYCKLCDMPDDVEDGWLMGAFEVLLAVVYKDSKLHNKTRAIIELYRLYSRFRKRLNGTTQKTKYKTPH